MNQRNKKDFIRGSVWAAYDVESHKIRPFVVTNPDLGYGTYALVAPSTTKEKRFPTDVVLRDWKEAKLNSPSIIRVANSCLLLQADAKFPIGFLSEYDLAQLDESLMLVIGLRKKSDE
ncbi:MAG: type II toxin-antitoxin system PemK/MazF family toxin [Turicibacter sp.]|nr:type II toxin-antitoxin system PemK/MazF family toxin [Turicibacter sp.]